MKTKKIIGLKEISDTTTNTKLYSVCRVSDDTVYEEFIKKIRIMYCELIYKIKALWKN